MKALAYARGSVLAFALAASAQAQYYYTDTFTSYNSGAWSAGNGFFIGTPQFTPSGLYGISSGASALIAYNNGGDGWRHEIRATFGTGSPSGDLYLATNTAISTGYRLSFGSNSYTNSFTVTVYDLGGYGTIIGGAGFAYNPSTTTVVRAIKAVNGIRIVIGNQSAWIPASGPNGSMGVGFQGPGGPITQAQLAGADNAAPGSVGTVGAWSTVNQVDLQWTAATDGAGSGVFRYNIYRNGAFIGSTRGLNYSDAAVTANTAYTYTVKAEDFFTNEGAGVNKSATTTPNSLTQTGVRPLGSYWGGGGESIDVRSGNLNYTMGLLKAQSRHGLGMGFALSYNSQTWRNADGMTWNMGRDVGYGYGFKLLAGSIYPVYNNGSVALYIFTDSSGAEYRLDVGSSGHWWSREGVYLHFDPAGKLWFSDGSSWQMGAVSWAPEQDAGTMYPTMVQDTNGNQIQIQYKPALGSATVNSSARLDWIWDARAGAYPNVTYLFTYGASGCGYADEVPHLTAIGTALPTNENYSFSYACQGTLASPFTGAAAGSAIALKTRTTVSGAPGANLTTTFDYSGNGSLELAKVTFPYGGTLRWGLENIGTTQQVRGVNSRYLRMSTGATEYTYTLNRNTASGWTELDDADGKSRKRWEFETNTASAWHGLIKTQKQLSRTPSLTTMRQTDVTWTSTGFGSPYIASQTTTIDPGQSYSKTMKSEQTLDLFGRLTVSKLYDFGALSTPKWETGVTYLSGPNYDSRWILNRVTGTTLKFGSGAAIQYFQASYDGGALTNRTGLSLWDGSFSMPYGTIYRGNLTSSGVPGFPQTTVEYDVTGMPVSVTNGGTTTQVTSYDSKNVAPTMITTGSLSVSTQYNSVYEVTQTTGPNGATTSATYDSVARTATETAATGAVVTYAYSQSAPQVTATVNGRWTKSYLDGLGRAVKVETGNGGTTVSTAETEYEPCGCSPMGKVKRVSMPYAPGGTKYWTVYTYDAAGRTVSVAAPNGAGTTTTQYEGNTTKVISPTAKWKKQTVDAAGNLTTVTEPNPAGGADWTTVYAYNDRNLLLTVTMARPSGTQVRSFTYNNAGQVLTTTNPENGTMTYTYSGSTGLLTQKQFNNGNYVTYVYL